MMKLKYKAALITGSSSGIGRYCVFEFAEDGAKVVVADLNKKGADETVKQIQADGEKAVTFIVDVSKPESVQALADFAIIIFGKIDILMNNAAIQINKTVEDMTFEEWNLQMTINFGGVFLCSMQFLPHLRETKGNIVNVSSVKSFFVESMCAGYCATKSAIVGLTKSMAIDHSHEGVRVNCVLPGYIDAGLAEGYFQA
jgi:NAD(P)-dependent dehydrogenase (short-subunit alcohol dehydrogenase family)